MRKLLMLVLAVCVLAAACARLAKRKLNKDSYDSQLGSYDQYKED
jgi:uncharacterized protein YceK